jgi:hypothetical protein
VHRGGAPSAARARLLGGAIGFGIQAPAMRMHGSIGQLHDATDRSHHSALQNHASATICQRSTPRARATRLAAPCRALPCPQDPKRGPLAFFVNNDIALIWTLCWWLVAYSPGGYVERACSKWYVLVSIAAVALAGSVFHQMRSRGGRRTLPAWRWAAEGLFWGAVRAWRRVRRGWQGGWPF